MSHDPHHRPSPSCQPRRIAAAAGRWITLTALVAAALPLAAVASAVDVPNAFAPGDPITAAAFNENFAAIESAVDDNDARIAALEAALGGPQQPAIPAGAILFIDAAACPAGWAEFADLRGRVPLGLPGGGSSGTTVGTALEDGGTRSIIEAPSHQHAVPSVAVAIGSSGGHAHPIEDGGLHDHEIRTEASGGYGTYGVMGTVNNAGGDLTTSPIENDGEHSHTITAGTGTHTHTGTTSAGNTELAGSPGVDVTMPYVQLLACTKL